MFDLQLDEILSGPLPCFERLEKLCVLDMGVNEFPASIARSLSSLLYLDLSGNNFTHIPTALQFMPRLVSLSMNLNQLQLHEYDVDTLASIPILRFLSLVQVDIVEDPAAENSLVWSAESAVALISITKRIPNLNLVLE